jgi:hypothetical protein
VLLKILAVLFVPWIAAPANQWVEVRRDPAGARRGSAIRYAPAAKAFFLWGFMNADPELPQENPLMEIPEYDVVAFDPSDGQWRSHLPPRMEKQWSRRLPLASVPRTYSGITTGSERTVMRGATADEGGVPRPDLNVVFDQVAYRPADHSLYYFTGGLTARYDVVRRRWTDLRPAHSPPPVLGGSLAHDPVHDEMVLFGGGHVAERGPEGKLRGYTGTWTYQPNLNEWRELPAGAQPPPRMNSRMVCDTKNGVLVLFGGDAQKGYLADTWLFDLRTRTWRSSRTAGGPEARAGHFTVYDPASGLVIIGGGCNRSDLTDMWGYDAAQDRWHRLPGQVPTGFYLSADIAPDERAIVLVTNTQPPGDRTRCNQLYPVRTTYTYRINRDAMDLAAAPARPQAPIAKRSPEEPRAVARVTEIPVNRWEHLASSAPARTWGSATFDTDQGRILYWGGGHCGYEGNDVDMYDAATQTWSNPGAGMYPERLWNHGVRPAGVSFDGGPWTDHGRRIYAYDPPSRKMIMVRPIRLTSGYAPEWLRAYPEKDNTAPDALVRTPSSYVKYATWSWDPGTGEWRVLGPAPAGVDTLLTTPHGVMGVNVNWPGRLNDAGYQWPWRPSDPPEDNAIFLFRAGRWERLGTEPAPQNLYEMTGLAYDSKRDRVLLHGGGARRDELWSFDVKTRHWTNLRPGGAGPPVCTREAVYIARADTLLIYGADGAWAYSAQDNAWRTVAIPFPETDDLPRRAGQNRAMVYDAKRDLVLLVLGGGGDAGQAIVYATRFR